MFQWRLHSSGMWHCVTGWHALDVSRLRSL